MKDHGSDHIGQYITFGTQIDPNLQANQYVYVRAKQGDTIRKIAANRGHPELVSQILALNTDVRLKNHHFLRSATQQLKPGSLIRLPGTLTQGDVIGVHADDPRPIVKAGYAKYDTVGRPGRVGLNRFLGYDPIEIEIPIQFEAYAEGNGAVIEDKIFRLEKMAGRGHYAGAASGPPAVIRVSVTDNSGNIVYLIPQNYQWSANNPTAPLYRISDITWTQGGQGDDLGRRIRQKAVVTVKQYTPLTVIKRSATQRNQQKTS